MNWNSNSSHSYDLDRVNSELWKRPIDLVQLYAWSTEDVNQVHVY